MTFLNALFISFVLCCITTPITIVFAKRVGLIDDPKKHKHPAILHTKPIPRAGGLALFLAIVLASFLVLHPMEYILYIVLIASFFVVLVGILDDKYDLSPYLRFGTNIFCASLVVFSGASIPFVTNPFNIGSILHFETITIGALPVTISQIFAIVWIVWVMNMLNWSKGVDGQMPGIAAIAAGVIGMASLRFATVTPFNTSVALLSFIVAGASLGFLVFNFYPAKIFPGYSSTVLGFLLGVLSIISSVKLATAILVLAVPMIDAVLTILRRILSKRSPFWHDKGHLHHLLLDLGLGQRMIAMLYWLLSLLLGIVSLHLSSSGKLFAIVLIAIVISSIIISLRLFIKREEQQDE